MRNYLDFEKPISDLEEQIEKLRPNALSDSSIQKKIETLEEEIEQLRTKIYNTLSPIQRMQLARHANRPNTSDYIAFLIKDFVELHGDRNFADDHSIIGGMGKLKRTPVMIIGHEKGKAVRDRVYRNFGMPHPEGYRKSLRLMKLAEKFKRPIITLIDTPGAYPGVGAEERGQSEAIARNLLSMMELSVPIVSVVIGEGGSGGALALGISDRILMLEHSIYSVISPEGCAAILWNDPTKVEEAADSLKMTSSDLLSLGVIDKIIPEPPGGAHRDPHGTAEQVEEALLSQLAELQEISTQELLRKRFLKFKNIGVLHEPRP